MITVLRNCFLSLLLFFCFSARAQTWAPVTPQPTTSILWDVFALDASTAWAVGNSGTVAIWNGTSWTVTAPLGTTSQRFGVWAADASNVYVVGISTGFQLHKYNGTSWQNLLSSTNFWGSGTIRTVWGSSATDVWIGGSNGRIYQWNGTAWISRITGINPTLSVNRIWGTDANNIWVVGATGGTNTGVIYKWNGASWDLQLSGVPTVRSVWGSSATTMWAVGGTGTAQPGQIYRLSGSTWTEITTVPNTLNHIYGSNANNIWAVGNGGELRYYNGSSWAAQTSGRVDHIYGVAVGKTAANNRLIAVGEGSASVNPFISATVNITPLPLTWNEFTGQAAAKDIQLNWVTSAEVNTSVFEVEHKFENEDWRLLATVEASGNAVLESSYGYKHLSPRAGRNYYRIKQVDIDGRFTYSKTISVSIGTDRSLKIIGNPVVNGKLLLDSDIEEYISIYDLNGTEKLKTMISSGRNSIDVTTWPRGVYILASSAGRQKFML